MIAPLVSLRMAIGKVESGGVVVIVGWPVDPTELRRIPRVNALHAGQELTIVDGIFALIDNHHSPRWIGDVADLANQLVRTRKVCWQRIHISIDRNAPHS